MIDKMSSGCLFVFLRYSQFNVFFASYWITSGSIMDQNITYKSGIIIMIQI